MDSIENQIDHSGVCLARPKQKFDQLGHRFEYPQEALPGSAGATADAAGEAPLVQVWRN